MAVTNEERTFPEVLIMLDDGAVTEKATDLMRECVRAAMKSKKPAEMTLTLKFTPEGAQMLVSPKLSAKTPAPQLNQSFFFPHRATGGLHLHDPRQLPIPTVVNVPQQGRDDDPKGGN